MIETMTAVAWAFSTVSAIANSEPGKKFIEGTIGKVAEKVTEAGIEKIGALRRLIVEKLGGNPAAKEALEKAEAGSVDDLKDVASYLDIAMRKDEAFANQVQSLIQNIKSCVVQGDDAMVQNNYDQSRGYQIKAEQGSKVYFVERMENPD